MPTEAIYNFIKIDDKTATSGQPTAAQFHDARTEGYEVIVNLVPNHQEHALADEDALVAKLGMDYHYIPVAWTNPTVADFIAFTEAMRAVEGKKVLVHCAANFRVTAFFSTYAMKNLGWDRMRADALVKRAWESRPDYKMDDTWRAFIDTIRQ